jgi:GNAT superfamily N-acetyltransferase
VDRATLHSLDLNFLDANRTFMGVSTTGEYVERRQVAIACCGLPVQSLNWGFLKPPYEDLGPTAEAVRAYFTGRKLPFQLTFRDAERAPARALEAAGWRRRADPTPGMALAMPASIPAPPAPLAIEEVRSPGQLAAFREAAFRGFGYPVAAAKIFLNERLLGVPGVRLYAGRVAGEVVATSALIATGAVGGIYWVATLEEQRGRGYGEALTWAAVAGGREAGCRVASLQASQLGRPVYARMGFAHVLDYEQLLAPDP